MFEKEMQELQGEKKLQTYSQFQDDVKNLKGKLEKVLEEAKKEGTFGETMTLALLDVLGSHCIGALKFMHGPAAQVMVLMQGIPIMKALQAQGIKEVDAIFVLPLVAGALLNKISKETLPGGNLAVPPSTLEV